MKHFSAFILLELFSVACCFAGNRIFIDDFGVLPYEKARSESQYVNTAPGAFVYRPECRAIQGQYYSDYAVVANPHWCGCGSPTYEDDVCLCTDGFWFAENKYDHTQGGPDAEGRYGGMLFINPQSDNPPFGTEGILVYSRSFANVCHNSLVEFEVWFRNATTVPNDCTNAELRVKDSDGAYIQGSTIKIPCVRPEDGWLMGKTTFLTSANDNLTIEIWNLAPGGRDGNDLLIDDISVSVIAPEAKLTAKASSSKYTITDETVTGPCNGKFTFNVTGSDISKVLGETPYYLWLYKTASMQKYEIESSFGHDSIQDTTLQSTETMYKVIVGVDEQACMDYYNGSSTGECIKAVETNVMSASCTPLEVKQESRNCNSVVFSASSNARWYVSESVEGPWTLVQRNAASVTVEITSSVRYVKAEAVKGGSEDISGPIDYYTIGQQASLAGGAQWVSDELSITSGDDIELRVAPDSYIGEGQTYTFKDQAGNVIGEISQADVLTKSLSVKGLNANVTYSVSSSSGCVGNLISVKVTERKSIDLSVNRDCNNVTINATSTSGSSFKWYKQAASGEWVEIQASGSSLQLTLAEDVTVKASLDDVESKPVYIEYQSLVLEAVNASTGFKGEKIDIVLGTDVTVNANATGFPESSVYMFYDETGNVVSSDVPYFELTPSIDKKIYAISGGCTSNQVEIYVQWPTVFTPYIVDGYNDDFVKGVQPAISLMVFDRSGNKVADSNDGWDGKVANGTLAMPDVYYYVAKLSDGSVRKGTVEIYQSR